MTIKFTVAAQEGKVSGATEPRRPGGPEPRPARVSCLLALAHRFEGLVRSGTVKDYAELARLGHVSRARVTQIMNLLNLAPAIQEYILWLPAGQRSEKTITERELRGIVRQIGWDRQLASFRRENH